MLHNPHLSWREIDANTIEVSAESMDGTARVRLVFENGDITHVEADDRARAVGGRTIPTRAGTDAASTTARWTAAVFRPARW
jgi:hypothetical protein